MSPATDFLPKGRVLSVQVGRTRSNVTADGKVWRSAITKEPVLGPVTVGVEGLEGDEQTNRKHHGGPDKAVCCFFATHYSGWLRDLCYDLPFGAFGENLTIDGLTEADLCIGDKLTVGDTVLQISQPRMPCNSVARRWNAPELPIQMERSGFTGFYCRVLQTGDISPGEPLVVTERLNFGWNLLRANRLLYGEGGDPSEITALRDLPAFTEEWRKAMNNKLRKLADS